jgi:hypothetical protein
MTLFYWDNLNQNAEATLTERQAGRQGKEREAEEGSTCPLVLYNNIDTIDT